MGQLPTWWFKTEYFWIGVSFTPSHCRHSRRMNIDYPHWDMPGQLKCYYLLQSANWLHQFLVLVLGMERPRSDFVELCVHHVVTLWLIGYDTRNLKVETSALSFVWQVELSRQSDPYWERSLP
jgi:very-long-chain ceramide synthase